MSDEFLYIIIVIISIVIITKVCDLSNYLAIFLIFIIIFLYYNYSLCSESFIPFTTDDLKNKCINLKDNLVSIINQKSNKCEKNYDDNKNTKEQINNNFDCYNLSGNEIVANNNINSWCDLNSIDIDIINKATEKINN